MGKGYRAHLFALCAVTACFLSGFYLFVRNELLDLRFQLISRAASGDIVVIAIDPHSLDEVGVWPWPRSNHANLIRRLTSAGASEIAFDIDFSSRSSAEDDSELLEALKSTGGSVILAEFQQATSSPSRIFHLNQPLPQFSAASWPAMVNVSPSPDGFVREYWPGEQIGRDYVPSMAAVLSHRQDVQHGAYVIDLGIMPSTVPIVSYSDVLYGRPEALARVAGKRVIVGSTAVELGDRFNVPIYGVISGPVLQVLAAESLLQKRDLHYASPAIVWTGLGFLFLAMLLIWRRAPAMTRIILLVNLSLIAELGATLVQDRFPVIIDTSLFHAAVAAYLIAVVLDELGIRTLFRKIAENRFQRFAATIGDGLVCTDAQFRITTWNPSASAIFGYRSDEVVGRPIDVIWQTEDGIDHPFSLDRIQQEVLRGHGHETVEILGRRKNGEAFPMEVCFSGWETPDGINLGAAVRDISIRKREEEKIRYLAEHDTLTGLLNRDTLYLRACAEIEHSDQAREVGLLLVGLKNFHHLNDTLGHASGDELLFGIAARLGECVDEASQLARLNADEFGILVSGPDVDAELHRLTASITSAFAQSMMDTGQRRHRISPSIGAAFYPGDCSSAEELFGCAHMALDRAKVSSQSNCVFYDRSIRDEMQARLTLEAELALAVANNEFELFYQPQIRFSDSALVGVEALIRWNHPKRGLLPPAEFIAVVNSSGISDQVASWVIKAACMQGAAWERDGHAIRVAVNLSPSLVYGGHLVGVVRQSLALSQLSPSLLEVEVTEDIMLSDAESTRRTFEEVRSLGVRVVLDDFGTGYASLSYLRKLRLDGLKIDRSFVSRLQEKSADAAIISSTITLAKHLGLAVIAEGVEDQSTALLLAKLGADEGQGYLFGKPMKASDLELAYALSGALEHHDCRKAAIAL